MVKRILVAALLLSMVAAMPGSDFSACAQTQEEDPDGECVEFEYSFWGEIGCCFDGDCWLIANLWGCYNCDQFAFPDLEDRCCE